MSTTGRRRAHRLALGVAAVGVVTTVTGVAATQPGSISASLVDLTALIVVGSSTNPSGAGVEDFFGGMFNDPLYTGPNGDDITYVNFLSGPAGIKQALEANAGEPNAIIASGWGAANASFLLLRDNPEFSQTVVVADNDVARPDGGFGTRYPWFALIGVNPVPTPSQTDALAVVNIGYEYDYNSNAPADVLNPFAAVNSLVAYLYRRLNQAELDLPVDVHGNPTVSCNANTCAITVSGAVLDCPDARCSSPQDRISAYVTTRDNTTYVTYTSDGLPLANLIRDVVPFGDRIADATEPLLKLLVDSAYYDGNPIPRDPSAYRPARPLPPPAELLATAAKTPGAIEEGLEALTSTASTTSSVSSEPPSAASAGSTATPATSAPPAVEESEQEGDETADSPVDTDKPLTNVVRNSDKAEPGKVGIGEDTDGDESKPVPTDDVSPTVDAATAPGPDGTADGTAEEADEADDSEQDAGDEGSKS